MEPDCDRGPPVEAGGYAFFVGQDPFYGSATRFAEVPADALYPGSHILGFDLARGTFRDFGIAPAGAPGLFGGRSAFWIAADPARARVYIRMGYESGPVHRLDVSTGKLDANLFECGSKQMLVGATGAVYFGSGKSGSLDLARFDPKTGKVETVAAGRGGIAWFKGQDGRDEVFGIEGAQVFRLDTVSGACSPIARFPAEPGPGDSAFRDGIVYRLSMIGISQGTHRAVELLTLDLRSGEAKRHGIILDQDDRLAQELWAMDVGPDGTIYITGCVYPRAGDAYAPRLKRYFLNDNRFLVIPPLPRAR